MRRYERMVAEDMWRHDGEPDGKSTYEADVKLVFDSLKRLGLKVERR